MKFVKDNEAGFLLLESLMTLGMIASILLLIYPTIVNWMAIRQEAKNNVELNRVFYEQSMDWEASTSFNQSNDYSVQSNENLLRVTNQDQKIEVIIYEYEFKK